MSVKLFVEGGAKGPLSTRCRAGFTSFLKRAGFVGHLPKVFSCGVMQEAYNNFCTAIENGEYGKGKHSFEILARIDPAKVRMASPYADRFLNTLSQATKC